MRDIVQRSALLLLAVSTLLAQQPPTVKWEELTALDFAAGIERSQGVCLLPFGVLEKHGPHLPLGTDLLNVRYVSVAAAQREFAVVFPQYFAGQIFEAMHEPGTVAYSPSLQLMLLQETTSEMARNGCKKIIVVNGHGGNTSLLPFFSQSQLASPRDYVVYAYLRPQTPPGGPAKKSANDGHAGESETAKTLVSHPDLVKLDRAGLQSGADRRRLDLPAGLYTGIWWYAKYPEHYAGDGAVAIRELGEHQMEAWIAGIANAIRAVKSDQTSLRLQNEFFEKSRRPLETKQ
ncbi:MAG: creatininase family protein [Bryobacteraceae bacterium]